MTNHLTLSINQLACTRDERVLFRDLSFTLTSGEALQITGENGSGKTSLLKCLVGLLDPSKGQIFYQSQPIAQMREEFNENLAYLGHKNGVRPGLTVLEALRMAATLHQTKPGLDLAQILASFALTSYQNTLAQQLSAGQKQRLALARLMVQEAGVWILDEPFTALDAKGTDMIRTLLGHHVKSGGVLIFTTHQPIALPDIETKRLALVSSRVSVSSYPQSSPRDPGLLNLNQLVLRAPSSRLSETLCEERAASVSTDRDPASSKATS